MHLSVESTKPLEVLREALRSALKANGLAVASESDSAQRAATGRGRTSFVLELADPLPSLQQDAAAATASTWKVAGYEMPGGKSRLSTMRPTELVGLLGHPELSAEALSLERALEAALKEAAGWDGPPAPV